MRYKNPHEAVMLLPPMKPIYLDQPMRFPSILLLEKGSYKYSDGSSGGEPVRMAVNCSLCPYEYKKHKHYDQTHESISLMVGLYAYAPEMYKALHYLLTNEFGAKEYAKEIMKKATTQDWKSKEEVS